MKDCDVLLDALVRVVHRGRGEPAAVVGRAVEPVVDDAIVEPDPPADHQPLLHVEGEQGLGEEPDRQHGEDPDVAGKAAAIELLQRGEQAVVDVGDQHRESHRGDRQQRGRRSSGEQRPPPLRAAAGRSRGRRAGRTAVPTRSSASAANRSTSTRAPRRSSRRGSRKCSCTTPSTSRQPLRPPRCRSVGRSAQPIGADFGRRERARAHPCPTLHRRRERCCAHPRRGRTA